MSESTKNLLKINELSNELSNSANFLNFKWDKYAVPIIDADFFDLFSRLVINQESFEFGYELSKDAIESLIDNGNVTDRLELDKLKKSRLRIDELDFEGYLSQNTLAIFKNPQFYINRLNESLLHTPLNNDDLNDNLKLIYLKNKIILGESGLPNLYLAFGFYTADEFNAPLIFIPVNLDENNSSFKLTYDAHDKIRLNTPLELKLKEQDISLPQMEINSEMDMISYLKAVNELKNIKPFITLGLFDFSTVLAFNDLKKFSETEELDNLLNNTDKTVHFNETEIDLIDENDSYNVFDADSSQISAIKEALLGDKLFIDAPIGSRKIETIVNLIAEIIANKKTVLYVSDKLNEIHETENRLSEIGLEKQCMDLYGNNYDYQRFIEEITSTSEYVPSFEFDKNYTESKLNELNELKGKLSNYTTFISTPYKKTGVTPYHVMGQIEKEYNENLDEYEMKGLSNLTNNEYEGIISDFSELTKVYVNKIYPVAEHRFNYITAKNISDEQFNDIITTIPSLKKQLEELIKLNDEINEEFGIKKLEKINDFKNHSKKLESLENDPQLMGDDYEDLKKYVDAIDKFQTKKNEYGSIDDLENMLLVEVSNTHLDLENQISELNKLNEDLTKLICLNEEFKSKISDAGIKSLNSIKEVEEISDSLDLLDKNPLIISDEEEVDSFVDELEKYQSVCDTGSPEDLLKSIKDCSKSALISTTEKLSTLIGYQEAIEKINIAIDDLNVLKKEIGLNEFKSIKNFKDDLKKSDILLSHPTIVDDEKAIDEFIELFKKGTEKFGNIDYAESYSKLNSEICEMQEKISNEISKADVFETNIKNIKMELVNIRDNANKLSNLLNIKKINSLKEIEEYCDNVEILLEDPKIIPTTEKLKIDAYIKLLEDIQNEEDYTKLDLDKVNSLIDKINGFNKKFKKLHFEYSVFNLDLKKYSRKLSIYEPRKAASPITCSLSYYTLNEKFSIFSKGYKRNSLLKRFSSDYTQIKREFKSYYKNKAPKEDEIIYKDYKNYLEIIRELDDIEASIQYHYKLTDLLGINGCKMVLNQLIDLQVEYRNIEKELKTFSDHSKLHAFSDEFKAIDERHTRNILNKTDFDKVLEILVPIKLKLKDIEGISDNVNSDLRFKKGIDYILKFYFQKTYFNRATNLYELYGEYLVHEEYKELLENNFFSKNSLENYYLNKTEVKDRLTNIKNSKNKFYYIIGLIKSNLTGNNIEIHGTSLDVISLSNKPFNNLIKYFNGLYDEINAAKELFNNLTEPYKIDDIDKIIENYTKLNSLNNLKEFVSISTYEKILAGYKDDFRVLNEFNSISEYHSSMIDKYFSNVWKDKSTSSDDLNNTFKNHKEFTKLYNGGFFSQNIFKFLEKSDDEIKTTIGDLNSKCDEISQRTNDSDGKSVFYECNLEEIDFDEYKVRNNEALNTIELLGRYSLVYSHYDDEIFDTDEKVDFESLDIFNQLYKDLNKLYNDSEVAKYNISFEMQMNDLEKTTENKNRFIDLIRLRNSIEEKTDIIQNRFGKIWEGPNTQLSKIKNKVSVDKSFTKDYNDGVFSEKTVDLISKDEHSFDNLKNEFTSTFNEIKTQIDKISTNPIILNEFDSDLQNTQFDVISQKASLIQKNINRLDSNYKKIERLRRAFNLEEITSDINNLDEIIQSSYIKYLDEENIDNLNKSNENLKLLLNNHNELQTIKNRIDGISIDSKYFKEFYRGYETSVSDMNQQLKYNKTYEDLYDEGFFSAKTDEIIRDKSKLNELNDLILKMENDVQDLKNSFNMLDLIHTEKGINLKKSLDEALGYVSFFNDNIDQLKDWIGFEKASKNIDNDVCHEFIKALYSDAIKPELINKTFSYNFARNLLNEMKQNDSFISNEDIDKYINLDKEVIGLNRLRVLNEYVDSKPEFEKMESQNPQQYRAYYKFNDLSLKNNGDIKEILDMSIDYIKSIKPIFIATTSSVFKYLSSCDFDYVIFDDVNQIKSEMAITTLLRADKKVVIGDSKQSNICMISLIKDKFKNKPLKWCYNARNTPFYDDELLAYPKQYGESIVEIVNVDNAIYDISSKINEIEAERTVELAIDHVKEYGFDKTLGIITFTKEQRDHIVKLLLEKLEDSPELVQYFNPLDSFYVKYIHDAYESRDIVLASLTYGYDKDKVLNIDFESENVYVINKIMTMSLEKTIVLSSLKRNDIVEGNNLRLLFEYQKSDASKDFELSLFEESVYNFLNENNFTVKKQLVDFTINGETAIECEGENFNKFKDVRDKFRLHKELLESLGWKSLHVCASEWIENRADYQNKLLNSINEDMESEIGDEIPIDDFEFDFEFDDEIGINELKELL